jgi:primosomal protein N' (replication factor Y)
VSDLVADAPVTESLISVEVLPDVSGIDRVFHYAVPPALAGAVTVGTIVRVALHGRRVRGYVVALGTPVPEGVQPQDIVQVVSIGPPGAVVDLCRWAAWRYAGRLRPFLMAASAPTVVRRLPPRGRRAAAGSPSLDDAGLQAHTNGFGAVPVGWAPTEPSGLDETVAVALRSGDAVLRLPPATPRLPVVLAVLEMAKTRSGDAMILVESHADALTLAQRLRRRGFDVCLYPDDWAEAAAGGRVVIGTRNVALAPSTCSVIVVLDAHSESYRSERAPTFDARVLASERGRREGVPVLFVTPCPSLELLEGRRLVALERSAERNGWPTVSVLDAREEDPREGGYPSRLVSILRAEVADGPGPERPVVLVLNRKGRARLLACSLCRSVQRCGRCGAALVQAVRPPKGTTGTLLCPSCGDESPALCANCGSARLRILRPGVSLAREQLATLLGVEVAELGPPGSPLPRAPVVIGTEAVLHAVRAARVVGFLDLDHELLSPRFRAPEQALVLLARAARLVGGRQGGGRLLVRTSMPDHDVVRAVQAGTPELVLGAEAERRRLLRLPPVSALAEVSGAGAAGVVGRLEGVEASLRGTASFLVRADSAESLADAFARLVADEPAGWAGVDARIEVDPLGV